MELGDRAPESEVKERSAVRHLLILGHPNSDSFTHAVAARYVEIAQSNYQAVDVRDLYASNFRFSSTHYFHAASVVDGMSAALAQQRLFDVGEKARLICAEAAAARHHAEI